MRVIGNMTILLSAMLIMPLGGCALGNGTRREPMALEPRLTIAVAPVLNMSNSSDWDALRVTDILAEELQSFPGLNVVPVNRALAALTLMGKTNVESPEDAHALAHELGADATIVAAITAYDPYEPPSVGIVMQWYTVGADTAAQVFDPVSASRQAGDYQPAAAVKPIAGRRFWQVQRVYHAAAAEVVQDLRRYGRLRPGYAEAGGWRIFLKSQELFVRYACWASIRTTLLERERALAPDGPGEAESSAERR